MPFEEGNKLGRKRRKFEQAIDRAILSDNGDRLRAAAEKIVDLASQGERWACEFLRDTLDGKPAQQIVATDTEGRSLAIGLVAYVAELRPDDPVSIQSPSLPTPHLTGPGQGH
jgi:hypothetical protein